MKPAQSIESSVPIPKIKATNRYCTKKTTNNQILKPQSNLHNNVNYEMRDLYHRKEKLAYWLNRANTGHFIGVSKGNNVTSAQRQGVITTTKDGSEKANYTFLAVGNVTEEGIPVFLGSAVWSTDSYMYRCRNGCSTIYS